MRAFAIALIGLAACAEADGAPEPIPVEPVGAEATPAAVEVLVINEVAAAGEPHDWFEVVNVSRAPVVLSEFLFVDSADLDKAAPFPTDLTLAPGARHVQDVTDAGNGFKLGGDEELRIYHAADRRLVDHVEWEKDAAPAGGSYARRPDGTGAFTTVTTDTRGESNR